MLLDEEIFPAIKSNMLYRRAVALDRNYRWQMSRANSSPFK